MYSKNFTKIDWQKDNDGGYYIVITDHNIKKPTCNVFLRNGQEAWVGVEILPNNDVKIGSNILFDGEIIVK